MAVATKWATASGWVSQLDIQAVQARAVRLLSSTESKYSAHIIFPDLVFSSNRSVGQFVSQVNDALPFEAKAMRIIDMSVYSRNRNFRLVGSSKFGRSQRLLPASGYNRPDEVPGFSKSFFITSLVQSVHFFDRHLDIGSSQVQHPFPRSTVVSEGGGKAVSQKHHVQIEVWSALRQYVQEIIGANGGRIAGVRKCFVRGEPHLAFEIRGNWRFCARIMRHHNSNGVSFVVNLETRTMYQRCFDPDCMGYRSGLWLLPSSVKPS